MLQPVEARICYFPICYNLCWKFLSTSRHCCFRLDSMTSSSSSILVLLCLVQLVGILFFGYGFFPVQFHHGIVPSDDQQDGDKENIKTLLRDEQCYAKLESAVVQQHVRKIILVVIDAWRAQFYFEHKSVMPFLADLEASGFGTAFDAHVQSPTVTMPRIKAFTGGSVPSFADVVFNFASTSITEDNLVDRLKAAGRKILFCGDDTWLRLFPGRFENQSEGTVSFYVNDYTEVDDNVTRCADRGLEQEFIQGWDVMILHYLGLDHIGHSLGGTHRQINIKLAEMDEIVKKLYASLKQMYSQNFTIVILGDHGMTEAGGHGGSSASETHVPLFFASGRKIGDGFSDFQVDSVVAVEQVDLVPTLSWFSGITIPRSSLGVTLVDAVLVTNDTTSHVGALLSFISNSRQFIDLSGESDDDLSQCIGNSLSVLRSICSAHAPNLAYGEQVLKQCKNALRTSQEGFLLRQTNVDLRSSFLGLIISIMATFALYLLYISSTTGDPSREQFVDPGSKKLVQKGYFEDGFAFSTSLMFIFLALQVVIFFASSLIEEEHDVQYFLYCSALFGILAEKMYHSLRKARIVDRKFGEFSNYAAQDSKRGTTGTADHQVLLVACLLVLYRLSRTFTESTRRRWLLEKDVRVSNETDLSSVMYDFATGIGSLTAVDAASFLLYHPLFQALLNAIVAVFTLLYYFIPAYKESLPPRRSLQAVLVLGFGVIFVKQTNLGFFSETFLWWSLISLVAALVVAYRRPGVGLMLWIAFLYRRNLFALFACDCLTGYCLARLKHQSLILYFALCASFFYSGNSNGLSTVDVSVGYTGVRSYQPIIVGFQLVLNTYCGPLCILCSWWEVIRKKTCGKQTCIIRWLEVLIGLAVFSRISFCLLNLIIQRHHLFIWSVFAPKLLYEFAHFVVFLLVIFPMWLYGFAFGSQS